VEFLKVQNLMVWMELALRTGKKIDNVLVEITKRQIFLPS